LDEIHVDVALVGRGVRLFDRIGAQPIEMKLIRAIATPGVTHLGYRVVEQTQHQTS
jgi:hypothetical protein